MSWNARRGYYDFRKASGIDTSYGALEGPHDPTFGEWLQNSWRFFIDGRMVLAAHLTFHLLWRNDMKFLF